MEISLTFNLGLLDASSALFNPLLFSLCLFMFYYGLPTSLLRSSTAYYKHFPCVADLASLAAAPAPLKGGARYARL